MAIVKDLLIKIGVIGGSKAVNDVNKIDTSFKGMAKSAAQAAGVFFASRGLINGLNRSLDLASKTKSVGLAFDSLSKRAGMSEQTLTKLRAATDGTINSLELMTQANNALLLGITDSEDQMAEMFDIAQRLAAALGEDTAFGVESLVTGLGRQSKLMLDNLGIMIDVEKANKTYAQQLGKTSKALTDAERKQAFVNAALAEGKRLVESAGKENLTYADRVAAVRVQIDELSTKLGEALIPVIEKALPFLDKITMRLKNAFSPELITVEELNVAIEATEMQLAQLANASMFGSQSMKQFFQNLMGGDKVLMDRLKDLEQMRDELIKLQEQQQELADKGKEPENNPLATPFLDFFQNHAPVFEASYDTFVNSLTDIEMSGKKRREQIWLSTRASFIKFTGEMIKEKIKSAKKEEVIDLISAAKSNAAQALKNAGQIAGAVTGYIRSLFQTMPWFAAIPLAAAGGAFITGLIKSQTAKIAKEGLMPFAEGGIVPGQGNTDSVPAILTPGELILNQAQQESVASNMGVTINISGNIIGEEEFVRDTLVPEIEKAQLLA